MNGESIPFNKATMNGREMEYFQDAVQRGHISGDGYYTKSCQELLQNLLGVPKVLLTTSCTHALEMTALLLDLQPEDEVILPSFTFVSTANAFALRGVRLVFCDIRPDTLNIDERLLPELITPKTKAIIVVHYGGVACAMDEIIALCKKNNIVLIEDNAHGLFAKYKGRYLGTFGALATQSFHETKNFTCGEGGALIINDPALIEKAEIIREKGTNRSRFLRGMVDKYTWVGLGSSYLPSDLLSAVLFAQLEMREQIQEERKSVWKRYHSAFTPWKGKIHAITPHIPETCEQSFHLYYLLLENGIMQDRFIDYFKKLNIGCHFHYQPLHLSPKAIELKIRKTDCPITIRVARQLVRFPLYRSLEFNHQKNIINLALNFI